ncbi:hypothetical protein [Leifsonia sp. Root112D2]|uniref:hypothetical protein n=1 Tax=Leifsonia sp. Root112D2 TaxID=1736426 RepID=UPI0006F647D3|nr:hypothetical protein [Leifsonia sp. Root112D2]KQV07343.1 hypothetical protein ASC63_08575 [Leifsonia sp. Root112D2]
MTLRATDEEKAEVTEYLEWQLGKTSVKKLVVRHVEKIVAENITGDRYEVWNCVTNQGKWWVVTPMMNFYTQRDFKSADVVLTFHVGMVGRIMSRDQAPLAPELKDAFSEPWRKWEDAVETMRVAQEAEDFQAVGMRLREAYVSMLKMVANDELVPEGVDTPQDANPEWLNLLADQIAGSPSNARLRAYLKNVGKETWQHVSWLTHATNATRFDAEIAVANISHLISVFTVAMLRAHRGAPKRCADCGSYRVGSGTCARCGWVDESYVPPEPRPEPSPEELAERLATPHTLSSDIDTFMSPEDFRS